jgi:hypothetical protein
MSAGNLDELVIKLHDIARQLEEHFGQPGALSDDIRSCAGRLNNLIKRNDIQQDPRT